MSQFLTRRAWLGCVAITAALASGCADERRSTVRGTVTLKGQPLSAGVVRIYSPDDRISTAYVQPDGSFAVTDVLPGTVRVAVLPSNTTSMPSPKDKDAKGRPKKPAAPGVDEKGARSPIPKKYQDVNTSGLSFTITPTTETVDVRLD